MNLGILAMLFTPIYKKVKFKSEKAAIDGSGILAESGGLEYLDDDVYGVFSERQLRLLRKKNIPFEIVE